MDATFITGPFVFSHEKKGDADRSAGLLMVIQAFRFFCFQRSETFKHKSEISITLKHDDSHNCQSMIETLQQLELILRIVQRLFDRRMYSNGTATAHCRSMTTEARR